MNCFFIHFFFCILLFDKIKHHRGNESKISDRPEARGTRGRSGGSVAAIIVQIQ